MPEGLSPRRMVQFTARHLVYLLWLPVLLVWGTFAHEGAHGLATILQGGTVTKLWVLPGYDLGDFTFGYMSFDAPPTADHDWIHSAPVIGATLTYLIAASVLARWGKTGWRWTSALIFFVITPIIDISMAISGLFAPRRTSDLYKAWSGHETLVAPLALLGLAVVLWRTWPPFLKICGPVLSRAEYVVGLLGLAFLPWITRLWLNG